MSLRASMGASPRACSGAMYAGVPTTSPERVMRMSLLAATPKSTILGETFSSEPSDSVERHKNKLPGLMSR